MVQVTDIRNKPVLCLISACLCGVCCRYDGGAFVFPHFARMHAEGSALAVCPEALGGLGIPREPCEIRDGLVVSRSGKDVTRQFDCGAALVLEKARQHGIRLAVLKDKSPSCGSRLIYDGSFSGRLVPGLGRTTQLLLKNGLCVYTEDNCPAELWER